MKQETCPKCEVSREVIQKERVIAVGLTEKFNEVSVKLERQSVCLHCRLAWTHIHSDIMTKRDYEIQRMLS